MAHCILAKSPVKGCFMESVGQQQFMKTLVFEALIRKLSVHRIKKIKRLILSACMNNFESFRVLKFNKIQNSTIKYKI